MAERQTRYVQVVVSERVWEFKSPLPHFLSPVPPAHSSSGQGHRPLKAETTGSNPVCAIVPVRRCACFAFMAHSSSGLGRRPFKAKTRGSNPLCAILSERAVERLFLLPKNLRDIIGYLPSNSASLYNKYGAYLARVTRRTERGQRRSILFPAAQPVMIVTHAFPRWFWLTLGASLVAVALVGCGDTKTNGSNNSFTSTAPALDQPSPAATQRATRSVDNFNATSTALAAVNTGQATQRITRSVDNFNATSTALAATGPKQATPTVANKTVVAGDVPAGCPNVQASPGVHDVVCTFHDFARPY